MSTDRVRELAEKQEGLLTRRQALDAGMAPSSVDSELRRGRWSRVLPGVYSVTPESVTGSRRDRAALLYVDADAAALTGANACRQHGLHYAADDGKVHVAVRHERHRASASFVCVHRTARDIPVTVTDGGVRVVSCADAVVDYARESRSLRDVRAVALEAVQGGLASVEHLEAAAKKAARRDITLLQRALGDVRAGVRSAPEAELRDLLLTSDLPRPVFNVPVLDEDGMTVAVVDVLFSAARVVVEVDSVEWHHADIDLVDATDARHNRLEQRGFAVLHFTPRAIRRRPAQVLAVIRATVIARSTVPLSSAS